MAAGEQVIFSANGHGADDIFYRVVITTFSPIVLGYPQLGSEQISQDVWVFPKVFGKCE
jgi:hypothetical protein